MILSEAAQTFDSTGPMLPVILPTRLLLKKLWKQKKMWNKEVGPVFKDE
jgi:Pao retrotransposon peptidase